MVNSQLFKQEAVFIAGAASIKQLPKLWLPQYVFIGKSNVGKSSLINSICRRKSLARVSHTPGRTQQINFFNLGGKIILADLPGYGFAKVAQSKKQLWEKLIIYYLANANKLALAHVLVDARRGLAANDLAVIELIAAHQHPWQLVFTKSDKIKDHQQLQATTQEYLSTLGYQNINIIMTSSKGKHGIAALQQTMS